MNKRTKVVAAVAAALVLAGGGVAWAVTRGWVTVRSEQGKFGDPGEPLTRTSVRALWQYADGDGALYPGHPAGQRLIVTNQNPVPVRIGSVVLLDASAIVPECRKHLTLLGVAAKDWPAGGKAVGAAHLPAEAIPVGEAVEFVIPNVLVLDSAGYEDCAGHTLKLDWKVAADPVSD